MCFNIIYVLYSASDSTRIKNLEKNYGVKMEHMEITFLEDQRSHRNMFCLPFVDKKWAKTASRKKTELYGAERLMQEDAVDQEKVFASTSSEIIEDNVDTG